MQVVRVNKTKRLSKVRRIERKGEMRDIKREREREEERRRKMNKKLIKKKKEERDS